MQSGIQIMAFLVVFSSPMFLAAQTESELDSLNAEISKLRNEIKPGKSRFLLRGYAHAGLEATEDELSFQGGSFNPIFLYKQSDRLMFESELEFELEDNELHIGMEYANISYLLSKTLTLRVGKFLNPFGIYVSRLHPAWINKFGSNPLGLGHGGILPSADIGVDLRGGSYLGNLKLNYSFYVVNGPQLNDGEEEPEEAGRLHYGLVPDNNINKTVGGRLGVFPFTNSSLELGFSGMYGKVGADGSSFKDVSSQLYAFDIIYIKSLPFMKSVIDIKGQYSIVNTDNAFYAVASDTTGATYTFDNKSNTSFIQLSLRPALLESKFVRSLEVAARYSTLKTPEGSEWESDLSQWEFGLNYWLDWRTVFKLTYRMVNNNGPTEPGEEHGGDIPGNGVFLHWAIGF